MRAAILVAALVLTGSALAAGRFDPFADATVASARDYSRIVLLPKAPVTTPAEVERLATASTGVTLSGAYQRDDGSWSLQTSPRKLPELRNVAQSLRRTGEFVWVELDPDQFRSQTKLAFQHEHLAAIDGIDSLIVTVKVPEALDARLAKLGTGLRVRRQLIDDVWVIDLPAPTTYIKALEVARALVMAGVATDADPDMPTTRDLSPNDPAFVQGAQWALMDPFTSLSQGIQMERVWDLTQGDPNLVIAVVDTGVLPHPEFASRLLPGYTFVTNPANSRDGLAWHAGGSDPGDWNGAGECGPGRPATTSSWHGTHVAGTIGAAGNNGQGTAGINWRSRILPVRVLGTCGGSTSDILTGMLWAAGIAVPGAPINSTPARVINMSLGGAGTCTTQYQGLVNRVLAKGSLVVAAAGNESTLADLRVPGSCLGLSTVGATGPTGDRAPYSNVSFSMDISAPGGDIARFGNGGGIYSTYNAGSTAPAGYTTKSLQGTSMAAPHVSGVASLMLSVNPSLTPADLKALMALLPTPFSPSSLCNLSVCGAGIVNATSSVALAGLAALLVSAPVVEYYHAGFDHFFITANQAEIAALDGGAFGGAWVRTGGAFRAYTSASSGGVPVCRFFSTAFAPKSSHFYTANPGECSTLKANPNWTYEGIAFYTLLPTITGGCADGATRVYRMYNNGKSGAPNHRFTTDLLVQQQYARGGWIPEGQGANGVGMCSPLY